MTLKEKEQSNLMWKFNQYKNALEELLDFRIKLHEKHFEHYAVFASKKLKSQRAIEKLRKKLNKMVQMRFA